VYYGTGLAGKTTSLEIIHTKTPHLYRSELAKLTNRVLVLNILVPINSETGRAERLLLRTSPGQISYDIGKLLLQRSDAVIFVVDSQISKREENLESWQNLQSNLREHEISLDNLVVALQVNKRDLPDVMTVEKIVADINYPPAKAFESVALTGEGVFTCLKWVAQQLHTSQYLSGQIR